MTTPSVVYLVDPFRDEREMYAEYLQVSGFDVHDYEDGERAFTDGVIHVPHLFVVQFRDLSGGPLGTKLTERLKAHPKTKHVPVLIVSTMIDPASHDAARLAGADSVVLLPCLPQQLALEARRLIVASRVGRADQKGLHGKPAMIKAPRRARPARRRRTK
jgi:two-component system cell cycle response regulator DivK